jgi:hypothetical protein
MLRITGSALSTIPLNYLGKVFLDNVENHWQRLKRDTTRFSRKSWSGGGARGVKRRQERKERHQQEKRSVDIEFIGISNNHDMSAAILE